MVLLNQTGVGKEEERVEVWRQALAKWPIVQDFLPLDAFTRCWVQEGILLERVSKLLSEARQPVMHGLQNVWQERNLGVFESSSKAVSDYLLRASGDLEVLDGQSPGKTEERRATRVLSQRLDEATTLLMDQLIEEHGLEGRFQTVARDRLREDFDLPGAAALSASRTTILGAAMGGAAGGLVADVAVGGLTFGGGAVAGALLGAAGAAGLRKGYQFVRGEDVQQVRWSDEFLKNLYRQSILRYLAVAHFGRGRGAWRETGNPERWSGLVEGALEGRQETLSSAVDQARDGEDSSVFPDLTKSTLLDILSEGYPEAAHFLGRDLQPTTDSTEPRENPE